ncbi:hypothetical protein [Lysobacter gummosus]|uniref:hypothetical protein n=1 Tax=Lysobacter gummosus TaxID=262324 RepID=UPI00362D6E85
MHCRTARVYRPVILHPGAHAQLPAKPTARDVFRRRTQARGGRFTRCCSAASADRRARPGAPAFAARIARSKAPDSAHRGGAKAARFTRARHAR